MIEISFLRQHFLFRIAPRYDFILKQAGMKDDAVAYMGKAAAASVIFSFFVNILLFFILLSEGISLLWIMLSFILLSSMFFSIILILPVSNVKKKQKEIETDLIYSVRYFLLKMQCGASLINALEGTAKLPTVSSRYFGELMANINIGTPIEEAVEHTMKFTPSDKFKEVLFQIKNSLKTGADVQVGMKSTLKELTNAKILEIKNYGKKLNPLTMFYMLIGTIVPSLGAAIIAIGFTFVPSLGSALTDVLLVVLAVLLILIQLVFYTLFKTSRPSVSV